MKKLHLILIAAVGFYLWRRSRAAQAAKPKATISGMGEGDSYQDYNNNMTRGDSWLSGLEAIQPRRILPGRGVMSPGSGSRGMAGPSRRTRG